MSVDVESELRRWLSDDAWALPVRDDLLPSVRRRVRARRRVAVAAIAAGVAGIAAISLSLAATEGGDGRTQTITAPTASPVSPNGAELYDDVLTITAGRVSDGRSIPDAATSVPP